MKISVITPNFNGERFLEKTIRSVLDQRSPGIDLEYIIIDGASRDHSLDIINRYRDSINTVISEPDNGPASAINKGLDIASGDMVTWLNADDLYYPGTIRRVIQTMQNAPNRALCFGRCRIVDENDNEIRQSITRFKEMFFPVSCRFSIQSINYISQPAMFFRRSALEKAGPLRENLKAAWDYEFILRLWQQGGGMVVPGGEPLAAFRWHQQSISGQQFRLQFKEEYEAAIADAGRFSLQALLHLGVRYGIVGIYSLMAARRGWGANAAPGL
jgi:glycosyltransferase involved in cell wall biosynthesis